jgi:hypothetical protein
MRVLNDVELTNTRRKLGELEALYEQEKRDIGDDEELREITMESLMRLINQLKEEISRSEVHQLSGRHG